jgi:hypothetical protein
MLGRAERSDWAPGERQARRRSFGGHAWHEAHVQSASRALLCNLLACLSFMVLEPLDACRLAARSDRP